MIRVTFDDGRTMDVNMCDKDFRRLLVSGANAECAKIEEQFDQDDYMTTMQKVRLEGDYDVLQDVIYNADYVDSRAYVVVDGKAFKHLRMCRDGYKRPPERLD